jgi:hypothetical protein
VLALALEAVEAVEVPGMANEPKRHTTANRAALALLRVDRDRNVNDGRDARLCERGTGMRRRLHRFGWGHFGTNDKAPPRSVSCTAVPVGLDHPILVGRGRQVNDPWSASQQLGDGKRQVE